MKKSFWLLLLLVLVLVSFNFITRAEEEFNIGVIPAQNQGKMQVAMDKLEIYLEDKLDKGVKIDVYPDYNGVVEAMNYNQVDMAFFGPLTYVIANHESGAQAIVTQLIDGEPYYHSYFITHKSSSLNSFEDVIERSGEIDFAFGDPNSTSGSLIPGIALREAGLEPENDFENMRYTGSHDATALAIEYQQLDVGAIDSAIFNILAENGKIDRDNFKIIWKSKKLFQYPWAVSKDTSEELISKLRKAFYDIEDEDILDAFGASDFVKAEDKDYLPIKKAAKKAGRIK